MKSRRGWHGESARHSLAARGIKSSRKRRRTAPKSLIVSSKELSYLRSVERQADVLEKKIAYRRKQLAELEDVIAQAEAAGDTKIADEARKLQAQMLHDLEEKIDKLDMSIQTLEASHPRDYSVRYLRRMVPDLVRRYHALEWQYGSEMAPLESTR